MIVVDCAAVVDALTAVEGTDELRAHLAEKDMHAPALLDFEFVSALRGLMLAGSISAARAQDALTDMADLAVHRWSVDDGLRRRIFSLREGLAARDAAYVALAEALECPLVTRDERLARSTGHFAEIVVL